ncbi:MAG: ATP-binding cassette domain-containing protein [Patescibacteria group bacterium]|jgi:ABC-2 type transport system ATP-binding protein
MNNVIEVNNLKKSFRVRQQGGMLKAMFRPEYKTVHAVKDVSFKVAKGEAVAFLGPNGAGKTTTIKMMTGLVHPSEGTVSVLDSDPFRRKPEFLQRIGLVMGNKVALNWDLTAKQSFNLVKNIYNLESGFTKKRISELAKLLDVTNLLDVQIRNLSLGERMKMELIGSILHKPEILFLDEPTIGLDILTKKRIRHFLKDIQKNESTTLILTSHDIDDIEAVCDRVIIINKGEKCYDDSIDSLVEKYQQNRYLRFVLENPLGNDQVSKLRNLGTLEKNSDNGETNPSEAIYLFKTSITNMVPLITHVLTSNTVLDMKIESVPLEDVIADLFRAS